MGKNVRRKSDPDWGGRKQFSWLNSRYPGPDSHGEKWSSNKGSLNSGTKVRVRQRGPLEHFHLSSKRGEVSFASPSAPPVTCACPVLGAIGHYICS